MAINPWVQKSLDMISGLKSATPPQNSVQNAAQTWADKQAAAAARTLRPPTIPGKDGAMWTIAGGPAPGPATVTPGGASYNPGYTGSGGGSYEGWFNDFLKGLGITPTTRNVAMLKKWAAMEGGWSHNSAMYNPLNTTQSAPGAVGMNSVGVKRYADYQSGLQAALKTITNGRYNGIIEGLRRSDPNIWARNASQFSTWGTGYGGWASGL